MIFHSNLKQEYHHHYAMLKFTAVTVDEHQMITLYFFIATQIAQVAQANANQMGQATGRCGHQ